MSTAPLGILASSGGAPADFELIATAFGTGGSRVIDFTAIPATYKHLQIRYIAKNSGSNVSLEVTFNGVTTSSYATHLVSANGSSVSSANTVSATSMVMPDGVEDNSIANAFVSGIIDIGDYTNTNKNTTLKAMYGRLGGTRRVALLTGFLNSTALINNVTLTGGAGHFTTASRFSLYGIKG